MSDVPRKGNVDRNIDAIAADAAQYIDVPRKGNVDRNPAVPIPPTANMATFPARGTWIEIRVSP